MNRGTPIALAALWLLATAAPAIALPGATQVDQIQMVPHCQVDCDPVDPGCTAVLCEPDEPDCSTVLCEPDCIRDCDEPHCERECDEPDCIRDCDRRVGKFRVPTRVDAGAGGAAGLRIPTWVPLVIAGDLLGAAAARRSLITADELQEWDVR